MTDLDPYISRQSAQKLLDNFGKALKQPEVNPLVFYAYGIGGVGKSTLLDKLRETYANDAKFARAFFGSTSKVDSPLALMEHLYKQLPDDGWGDDTFTELCQKYRETLHKLETESADGKGAASAEQVSLVKKLVGGAVKMLASLQLSEKAAEQFGKAAEGVVDVASLALSEKDRLEQLVKQHRATKNKRELQELMLDPLPKLTQAFAAGVIQKAQQHPIVLELDTYEKASSDFDVFLCKYLLGDTALQTYPVRIVMAGRYSLKNKRYQRMFQHHWNLIYERQLEKFIPSETKAYLRAIGIDKPNEVRRLTQASKGLPYFLKLIKDQKEDGRSLNALRDNDEIVDRLLDGLTPIQKQAVRLAAHCRWFDRPMIQYLVEANLTLENQVTEAQIDWFDWLIDRDFVVRGTYRIDDVARDVIRAEQHKVDEQGFRHVHDQLAQYFQQLADHEVAHDQPAPARYENSDWRRYVAETAYHALFANRDKGQFRLLTYFFEGAHLKQPDVAISAFIAVAAEAEPKDNKLLPEDTQRFLDSIQLAIMFGWQVIGNHPDQYEFNLEKPESAKNQKNELIKAQIESALESCFRKTDHLTGLAKYAGLMSKMVRCQPNQQLTLVRQAKEEAEKIVTLAYPEFSSVLFLDISDAFDSLDLSQEALDSFDKAIGLEPDHYGIWNNRGLVLRKLKRFEEALDSFDKAIELKPDAYPWRNRGLVLENLERYDEALCSYDKALELKPDYYKPWSDRGNVLENLERYDEALCSYDKALECKSDAYEVWARQGDVLRELRRYEEALTSYDKALKVTKGDTGVWNSRGLCLSFLQRHEEAISNLKKARDLDKKEPLYLANQGIVLARVGRYAEALDLCEQALNLKEDEGGHYGKACCYALQGHDALAIESLRRAIEYAPRRCRLEAKYNPDFDRLRQNEAFQALF
ncbi:MAG: tetratricopeptide repeat protein [Stenomitos rutilans HA7619-LM2]|jgi:tetratricopeptide (TPR) repeat protein|nr:tetratricopeptide repeat protein [Stenomitos rutilans HA7619-LM2]